MNNLLTNRGIGLLQEDVVPASGRWSVSTDIDQRAHWSIPASLHKAGLGIVLAISTVTCGTDPWFVDRRRIVPFTRSALFEAVRGRRVNMQEARKIAIRIILHAEETRRRYAEEESQLGIDWGREV